MTNRTAITALLNLLDTGLRNGAFTPGAEGLPTVEANNREAYREGLFRLLPQVRREIEALCSFR